MRLPVLLVLASASSALAQTQPVGWTPSLPDEGVFIVEQLLPGESLPQAMTLARRPPEDVALLAEYCLTDPVVMAPEGLFVWMRVRSGQISVAATGQCRPSGAHMLCRGTGVVVDGSAQADLITGPGGFALRYASETRLYHRCDGTGGLAAQHPGQIRAIVAAAPR